MNTSVKIITKIPAQNNEIVIFVAKTNSTPLLPANLPVEAKKIITAILQEQSKLTDYEKSTALVYLEKNKTKKVILLGIGEEKDFSLEKVRMLGGSLARLCREQKMSDPCLLIPEKIQKTPQLIKNLTEGMLIGGYIFEEYKSKREKDLVRSFSILSVKIADAITQVKEAQILAESVNLARDLINRPGNVVCPAQMVVEAKLVAAKTGMTCKVLVEKEMEKLGMGALLSVARGSVQPPKLIVLEYTGDIKSKNKTAFVGKGVTFDSGGISIKPSDGMGEMKDDMGGAAAVLAAMQAIAQLKLPVNITAVLPCVENMPSGSASKPGDIVKAASGKTIEIISTDAEGRMILADAVWYAGAKLGVQNIIDIATLTGAASVALGEFVAGVVTSNQSLCDIVIAASRRSGEKCWQMPSYEEYKEYNNSDVADIKNSGGRFGGMITGGLFIGEFTDKPWVHIDIGNTVTAKTTKGYNVKGPTGFGVRLLVETAIKLIS